jgi:general secretion pathway protein L
MSDTLFIRLPAELPAPPSGEASLECASRTDHGIEAERVPLAALAQRAAGKRVVAFVPAADTLALTADLPPMSAVKARTALPYALEDQLAGDLDTQHFALGTRIADGRWPVRVMARARLERHLGLLRGAGVEPQAMIAEADGLRDKPGDLMLWLDGEDAHWRAPGRQTVTLPVDAMQDGAAFALGDTAAGTLGLRVHGAPADLERHAAALDAIGTGFLQTAKQALPEGPLPWLAAQYDPAQAVNLLQGEFTATRARPGGLDAWRWPLRLAAAAVALQLVGWGLEAWRLHRLAAPVEAALLQAARPLDPAVQDAEAARALLRSRLADWDRRERDPAASPLVQASATVVDARVAAPSLQLAALRQQEGGKVAARFEAGDAAAAQTAREALLAAGWTLPTGGAVDNGAGGGGAFTLEWSAEP